MSYKEFRDEAAEEIETILAPGFRIHVTKASVVPHASDPAITFPNLDENYQRCKVIETAALYIDIRRSTELNLEHKPEIVAKLYSTFVRAMVRCASHHRGHVRGIIGDRLMVIFNPSTAFVDALGTAILMNSTVKYVLNKHFTRDEVTCGIGIDFGRMLVTKTGIRRHGVEQQNYRSLVWLGRPANVASKLTDIANKGSVVQSDYLEEGFHYPLTGTFHWQPVGIRAFVHKLQRTGSRFLKHPDNYFFSFVSRSSTAERAVPPILMTAAVYNGFRKAAPESASVAGGWWTEQPVEVAGYQGKVYGGDVVFTAFKS